MTNNFNGFNSDTYLFLMELQFYNDKSFFDANRERYYRVVREPMLALAERLAPTMNDIDPLFNTVPAKVLSRIRRDTRFSKNKLPYRDHAWLGYKHPGEHTSEAFCMYFEIDTKGYGYGMGMYDGNADFMRMLRTRMLADPSGFLALANDERLKDFVLEGEAYKRDRFPDAPAELKPYLNRKGLSWCFYSTDLTRTLDPALADEVTEAMRALTPLYRYVTLACEQKQPK